MRIFYPTFGSSTDNLAFQVVIVCPGDPNVHEFPYRQFFPAMDNHFVIHFHGIEFGSPEVPAGLFFIDQRPEDVTDLFLVLLLRDLLLHLHDLLRTKLFFGSRYRIL